VTTLWAATNDVIKRIGAGETIDLAIIAGPAIEALIEKASSSLEAEWIWPSPELASRCGPARPTSTSVPAKPSRRLCSAPSRSPIPRGPSGVYIAALLQKWGSPIS
jgi:hypothetical protein